MEMRKIDSGECNLDKYRKNQSFKNTSSHYLNVALHVFINAPRVKKLSSDYADCGGNKNKPDNFLDDVNWCFKIQNNI